MERGFYWIKDNGGAPTICEWAPACGENGVWFVSGVSGTVPRSSTIEICSPKLTPPMEPIDQALIDQALADEIGALRRLLYAALGSSKSS